eukprot:scaffold183249_cov30-Attheya_sp.AAC.1
MSAEAKLAKAEKLATASKKKAAAAKKLAATKRRHIDWQRNNQRKIDAPNNHQHIPSNVI